MHYVSQTHQGLSAQKNEDSLLIRQLDENRCVLVIADGLGGNPGGEVASSLVCQYIKDQPVRRFASNLPELLAEISTQIIRHGAQHPIIDGMGSTATLAVADKTNICWAHVGDSRLYHFSGNDLHRITRDQTLARQAYEHGEIRFDEIRGHRLNHVLEQCLGEDEIEPDSGEFTWQSDDFLLLSTDGLHDMMDDAQIRTILRTDIDIEGKADLLVNKALEAGGRDNISLIIAGHENHED